MRSDEGPILLYDGRCGLCDRTVQWILDHDSHGAIRFAALQSDVGRQLLQGHGLDPAYMESLVFLDTGGRVHLKSDGAIALAAHLPRPWRWLRVFHVIPRPLRDRMYDVVAKYRLKFFGTVSACRLPTPEQRVRFLP